MKKWMKWYIAVIIIIVGIYMYAEYKRPPEINWSQTFNSRDKIPFGTFVLYNELTDLFNQKPFNVREPLYDHMNNNEDSGEVYIVISGSVITSEADESEMLNYISYGNTVFISSDNLSSSFQDSLGFHIQPYYIADSSSNDSASLYLVNPAAGRGRSYAMLKNTVDGYFTKFDTATTVVLGMNNYNEVNFIRLDIGAGHLYIHSAPLAFSNYFMLKEQNLGYVEGVLSYLPKDPTFLVWDEFYSLGRGISETPLRVILTKPALKYAYFTALAAMLIYLFFQSKRRQRIIPVVEKPGNATLEFVETVARVYYNQKNHRNIALKKITYLFDYIRTRYGLQTQHLDETFTQQLANRSGVSSERVQEMIIQIQLVRAALNLKGEDLLKFSREADRFKKEISG